MPSGSAGRPFASILWISMVLLSAVTVRAQQKPPAPAPGATPAAAQVEWVASFVDAQRISKESKKPLFVAFNMDHEVANDEILSQVYRDPKFVERSRQFVCVIGSIGEHESVQGATGTPVCRRFGAITCADHKQCEMRARETLIGGTLVIAPQHLFVAPDGHVLSRRAYTLMLADMLKMMDAALRACGIGGASDPKAEKAQIAALLEQAEKARSWEKDKPLSELAEIDTPASHAALLDYALKGGDDGTRVAIMKQLGRSGDYTALDTLCKVAKDREPYLALAAVDALGKLRLPEAKEQLRKALGAWKSGNDRGRVLRALACVGGDDPSVVQLVLKDARGTDVVLRGHAICAMGSLPSAPEIDKFLKKTLDDSNTAARAAAAWAIGMGRHKNCRAELEKMAGAEKVVDVKELAETAIKHLDHPIDDPSCCGLEYSIWRYVTLGDPRRD